MWSSGGLTECINSLKFWNGANYVPRRWPTSPNCEMKNVPKYQSQGKSEIQNERSRCGPVVVMVVGKGTCGVTWMRRRLFYISTTGCTASTCANTQSELHRRLDVPSPLKHFYIWMRRFTTECICNWWCTPSTRGLFIFLHHNAHEHTNGTLLLVQIHDVNWMYIQI